MQPASGPDIDLHLRAAGPNDLAFQFEVYCGTREEEVAAWGWPAEQQAAFLRMQFNVRRGAYASSYPEAEESILEVDGVAMGTMMVARSAREIRLVDIALVRAYRNRGWGARLVGRLIRESAGAQTPLRLTVQHGNPAIHLYERLGFVVTARGSMYSEMEYAPAKNSSHDSGS